SRSSRVWIPPAGFRLSCDSRRGACIYPTNHAAAVIAGIAQRSPGSAERNKNIHDRSDRGAVHPDHHGHLDPLPALERILLDQQYETRTADDPEKCHDLRGSPGLSLHPLPPRDHTPVLCSLPDVRGTPHFFGDQPDISVPAPGPDPGFLFFLPDRVTVIMRRG